MPMPTRPNRSATATVVPEPAKGSRTRHGTGSAGGQVQVGDQPSVCTSTVPHVRPCGVVRAMSPSAAFFAAPVVIGRGSRIDSRFICRAHGAPQVGQAPRSEVPARMHGSTSFSGKVAKWASGYGSVAIVQTERLFRPAGSGNG